MKEKEKVYMERFLKEELLQLIKLKIDLEVHIAWIEARQEEINERLKTLS